MEAMYDDKSLRHLTAEDVYTLAQLRQAKKFLQESNAAVLLKTALICWTEASPPPDSVQQWQVFADNYQTNFYWKQLQVKDEIKAKVL